MRFWVEINCSLLMCLMVFKLWDRLGIILVAVSAFFSYFLEQWYSLRVAKHQAISRVCYSFKDAETINISKMMDDNIFAARQIETLYYVDYRKTIKVVLFTDSEPTQNSFISTLGTVQDGDLELLLYFVTFDSQKYKLQTSTRKIVYKLLPITQDYRYSLQ